jgi:primosomal protein N' (replication factor Y)
VETTVDVLLPLAVPGAYTYLLPAALAESVTVGSRVVVPLGPRKRYTAIVVRRPGTPPAEGVKLKAVVDVVDATPLLLPPQLDLWRWIASYYLCTPGEVMKAALPTGLKLESESCVQLADDADAAAAPVPGSGEARMVEALADGALLRIDDLLKRLGNAAGLPAALRRLIDSGRVVVCEHLKESFRPRTVVHLRLAEAYRNETALHFLLDRLKRSPRRREVVLALLDEEGRPLEGVARSTFLHQHPAADGALAALRREHVVESYEVVVERLAPRAVQDAVQPLSNAQQTALEGIRAAFARHPVCLLHGVTAGGKTEVYIHLIEEYLQRGQQVLYLVPEIALTTQLTERLGRVFGDKMGVYHSKFPDAERTELWHRQLTDRAYPLVLGVRSSVFLPFRHLGLVIVDEEHEASYKQQDPAPRYHARDVAIVLAQRCGAQVLLGTATPAVETYYNATVAGKYGLVRLAERYGGVQLPEIVVEDVKELRRKKLMKSPFSPRLIAETRRVLADGGQAIFFQNRRGYSPVLECCHCGWTPRCKACDVTLTYHRQSGQLVCHYCGAHYAVPTQCPNCEEESLRDVGYGTEKIEETVAATFPEARTGRMDLDTTRSRTAYERLIRDFQEGRTNLLVGTQMVTKGLDFGGVRVVGILQADQMLNQPNFRAYERAFQMMSQVAGRAGRRDTRGLVVLQTRQPDLPVVKQVVAGDYEGLFRGQLVEREMFRFPPYYRLVVICLKHRDEAVVDHAARHLAALLRPHFGADLLGPDRPAVARVQYRHLRQLLLKVAPTLSAAGVRRTLLSARDVLLAQPAYRNVGLHFDVDPM